MNNIHGNNLAEYPAKGRQKYDKSNKQMQNLGKNNLYKCVYIWNHRIES